MKRILEAWALAFHTLDPKRSSLTDRLFAGGPFCIAAS